MYYELYLNGLNSSELLGALRKLILLVSSLLSYEWNGFNVFSPVLRRFAASNLFFRVSKMILRKIDYQSNLKGVGCETSTCGWSWKYKFNFNVQTKRSF